ncbi:DUF3450 domain-containing protein [Gammaproteobacteria bacterium]|nr:DUF3450 domain-containing protein [Gammaproteobacteria bacterium]
MLRSALLLTFSALTFVSFSPVLKAAQAQPSASTEIQDLLNSWLSIEEQISAITANWKLESSILEMQESLLQEEIRILSANLAQNTESTTAVDEERERLLSLQTNLESSQESLTSALSGVIARLNTYLPQLPPPLSQSWQEKLSNLAEEKDNSLSLQTVLELLTAIDDFNSTVIINQSIIQLNDGRNILTKQLYLGTTAAWYVSANGEYSGVGFPSQAGWQWSEKNSLQTASLQQAIAMIERNVDIDFVALPFELRSGTAVEPRLSSVGGSIQ